MTTHIADGFAHSRSDCHPASLRDSSRSAILIFTLHTARDPMSLCN